MKYLDDYDVLMSKRSQLDGLVFLRTLHPGPEGHTNKSSLRESNYILSPSGLTLHSSSIINHFHLNPALLRIRI